MISDPLLFQWLELIINNCSDNGENVAQLNDINDIHNGIFAIGKIHYEFDPHKLVILKVHHICPPNIQLFHFSTSLWIFRHPMPFSLWTILHQETQETLTNLDKSLYLKQFKKYISF